MKLVQNIRLCFLCAGAAVAVLMVPAAAQGQQILSDASVENGRASAAVIKLGDELAVGESRADRPGDPDGQGGTYSLIRLGEDDLVDETTMPEGIDLCLPAEDSELCVLLLHSANETGETSSGAFGTLVGIAFDNGMTNTGAGLLVGDSSAGNDANPDSGTFNCGAQASVLLLSTSLDGSEEDVAIDSDAAEDQAC